MKSHRQPATQQFIRSLVLNLCPHQVMTGNTGRLVCQVYLVYTCTGIHFPFLTGRIGIICHEIARLVINTYSICGSYKVGFCRCFCHIGIILYIHCRVTDVSCSCIEHIYSDSITTLPLAVQIDTCGKTVRARMDGIQCLL